MFTCPGCSVEHLDGVRCSKCLISFCFSCANISEVNYRKLGVAKRAALLCASCKSSQQQATAVASSSAPSVPSASSSSATLDQVLQELRSGICGINIRLEQLPTLIQEVKDIRENFRDINESIHSMKQEIQDNKTRTHDVELKTLQVEKRVINLETKVANINDYPHLVTTLSKLATDFSSKEQRDRLNNVEIKGIPIKKNENLIEIVCQLGDIVGQPVSPSDINFVTRARSSADVKPIIVGFLGRYIKGNFVASARATKNLTAEKLGFLKVESKIYVNDHLTSENKQLLTKVKKLAAEKNYKYTWVQNCRILIRKNDTSPIILIQSEGDIAKIK